MTPWLPMSGNPVSYTGWYATISCWDMEAGPRAGPLYWDGALWRVRPGGEVAEGTLSERSPQRFPTRGAAEAWALRNYGG